MRTSLSGASWRRRAVLLVFTSALAVLAAAACAQSPNTPAAHIDTGDTAWMLVSAAFVLLMTPGLALFYGGMVRSKNVLNTLMQSFGAAALVTILWVLCGYSLAFSPGSPFLGGLQWLGLRGVGQFPNAFYGATIPHQAFMTYQMMFAIITPALISGAVAERMKFSAYFLFIGLWSLVVYCPLAHMVWGQGGFLHDLGALDFAGGTVVHISSGISALVLVLQLGKRRTAHTDDLRPHNLPMTLTGTALLWFGWFGFNAGSAIGASGLAAAAFLTTHVAAAAAALVWMVIEWRAHGRPTALGVATGAVAGLVAITPAAGFVSPLSALVIGGLVALISYNAINLKSRFGYDDTLDVFGVHGVGGIWGAVATGLFATTSVNPAGANGLLNGGGFALLGKQLVAIGVAIGIAVVGTLLISAVLRALVGLRVSPEEETAGLDLTQHGETAYAEPGYSADGMTGSSLKHGI